MIISDKHKYVFIQIPRTGCTAIAKELRQNYDGKDILHKHANYHEFLKVASEEQKQYYVFASVRNPLDDAVSTYSKLLTDHHDYTNESLHIKNGGWISEKRIEMFNFVRNTQNFDAFLRKYYKLPFTSNININKRYCNHILRFETLDKDLSVVLEKLGITKVRPLPVNNKTDRDKEYSKFYEEKTKLYAIKIFGPFMKEWGYSFPEDWNVQKKLNDFDKAFYKFVKVARELYSRQIQTGFMSKATFLRNKFE